jgi:hypothetical protein
VEVGTARLRLLADLKRAYFIVRVARALPSDPLAPQRAVRGTPGAALSQLA